MNRERRQVVKNYGSALGLCAILLLGGCVLIDADVRQPDRPDCDEQLVQLTIDYEEKTIRVNPEVAVIYFRHDPERWDRGLPREVRWLAVGKQRGHSVRITPKDGSSPKLFDMRRDGDNDPYAFTIGPRQNSLSSGEPQDYPKGRNKEYVSTTRWRYDIAVLENGKVLFEVDPEIVIMKYPDP